jgi:hypothetical protein
MANKPKGKRGCQPKAVLRFSDLDLAKSAVLNSLSSSDAPRGYRHAIDEFIDWYCSEPRLSFSKNVVLRYRIHLESRCLAPGTINLRLGAVRRLAYEASDCAPEPRSRRWHTTGQGRQEDRRETRKLAHAGTIAPPMAGTRRDWPEG